MLSVHNLQYKITPTHFSILMTIKLVKHFKVSHYLSRGGGATTNKLVSWLLRNPQDKQATNYVVSWSTVQCRTA